METQVPESPYAPPRAALIDVEDTTAPTERPPQVGRAVLLLWIGLGLGTLKSIWNLISPMPGSLGPVPGLLSLVFGLLLMSWIYNAIGRGRNWARILFLIFTALGLLAMPFVFRFVPQGVMQPLQLLLMAANTCLQVYVSYLLLTKPVREWFYAMKGRK